MKKNEREYRNISSQMLADEQDEKYLVEGYACTFDEYTVFEIDGIEYKEKIEPSAFDDCDFSDVVVRIDHNGAVYARSKAGTVKNEIDDKGLHTVIDLSRTQNSRNLYEDIKAGNYPQMSFCFSVREDSYDKETHTRKIIKIDKVYDVSPVSFPANPNTELHARNFFDGVIEKEKQEREIEARREALMTEILTEKIKEQIK